MLITNFCHHIYPIRNPFRSKLRGDFLHCSSRRIILRGIHRTLIGVLATLSSFAQAEISDITISDVTTRAFSVIWVSDQPVESARIKLYSDQQGQSEIAGYTIQTVSPAAALARGIVKIDVRGLAANTVYYVSGEMTDNSGDITPFPNTGSALLPVKTALETSRIDAANLPIANDILKHPVFELDRTTPSTATLVLISLPLKSEYPVSAFGIQHQNIANVLADLNNLYASDTHKSLKVAAGEPIEITEFRGNACELAKQKSILYRRLPQKADSPPVAEIETPQACFAPDGKAADFNCDSQIAFGDFNVLLAGFGQTTSADSPNCSFNHEFDLNQDQAIDYGDFNVFLSVFGKMENTHAAP